MEQFQKFLEALIGPQSHPQELTFGQLLVRAFIVCFVTFVMIRMAGRRFLAQKNPVDALLGFLLASMMSRAINGSTTFWGTLGLGLTITFAYRVVVSAACKNHALGKFLKGDPEILAENSSMNRAAMKRFHVSEHDLHEDLRLAGGIDDLNKVKVAQIERNGEISVQRQPRIVEIKVEDGVKTVQLLIE